MGLLLPEGVRKELAAEEAEVEAAGKDVGVLRVNEEDEAAAGADEAEGDANGADDEADAQVPLPKKEPGPNVGAEEVWEGKLAVDVVPKKEGCDCDCAPVCDGSDGAVAPKPNPVEADEPVEKKLDDDDGCGSDMIGSSWIGCRGGTGERAEWYEVGLTRTRSDYNR